MATGALAHLFVSRQDSFGTPTTTPNFVPFVSESLIHAIDLLTSEGIKATLVEPDVVVGGERSEGDIVMEPHPIHIGHFMRGVFGQGSSTTLTSDALMDDYTHTFNFRLVDWEPCVAPLPPYTVQIWRGVEQAFEFSDCMFSRLEMEIEAGALMRATVGALCRTTTLQTQEAVALEDFTPWTWVVASASIAGVGVDFIEQLTVTIETPIEGVLALGSRRFSKFARTAFATVRVSGRIDLCNLDEYDQFVAQSERALFVNLARTTNSGETMLIEVPSFRYEELPIAVGGPGRITVDFSARAIYNVGSAQALTITLTNTFAEYQAP